jgi:hypothetical protein
VWVSGSKWARWTLSVARVLVCVSKWNEKDG